MGCLEPTSLALIAKYPKIDRFGLIWDNQKMPKWLFLSIGGHKYVATSGLCQVTCNYLYFSGQSVAQPISHHNLSSSTDSFDS